MEQNSDALVKGHQIEGKNIRISTIIDISELKIPKEN